jgi:hypothetical protein
MSTIRCIYHDTAPEFPASDQHPDARRYGPLTLTDGSIVFVDAIGAPTSDEVLAVLNPPVQLETPAQKLAATGLSVAELKVLLALPT